MSEPIMEHVIIITAGGEMRFVWDDELACLRDQGAARIQRVSDVEPTADGQWMGDLSRIGGPVVGPYPLRTTALEHEKAIVTGRLIAGQLG